MESKPVRSSRRALKPVRYRDDRDASSGSSNKTAALSLIQRMALQGNRLTNVSKSSIDKSLASKRPFSEVLTPEDVSRRLWQEFGHAPQISFPKFQPFVSEGSRSTNSSQPKRMLTKFKGNDGRSDAMVMHSVTSARGWSAPGVEQHRIKAEYRENFELTRVWYTGVSLTVSGPMCVRVICFLCGSAGKHEMLYCNVCCEPYHEFCLEEEERPHEINSDNWCCKRCQFCQVCGRQNNLLQCDKCQNTYHPECLGPNYPTKPSKKKNIWICTKCVKCKSCGATTPGSGSAATWMYDFQLCYECGQLMDKGNYCPICHKCYTDDDWDSKMVQCASCESWVHAKCEELTDEMYERMSILPEDVHYICKICSPKGTRHWELVLKDSFLDGLKSVFNTVTQAKCAQHLLHIDEKKAKELEEKLNEQKYGDALKTTIELEKSLENFVTSLEKVLKNKNKSSAEQQPEEGDPKIGTSVVDLVDENEVKGEQKVDEDKDDSVIRFEGDEDLDETKSSLTEDKSDVEMAEVLNDSETISIGDGETLSALTTPGVSGVVTPASSAGSPRVGAEEGEMGSPPPGNQAQGLGNDEAGEPMAVIPVNIPNVPLLLGEEKDEVDGSEKKGKSVKTPSDIDNQNEELPGASSAEAGKEKSQPNICDTDNSEPGPKLPTDDQNINLIDREIKQEQIENVMDGVQTSSPVVPSPSIKDGGVVDLTVEKSVSFQLSSPMKGLITPTKAPGLRLAENRLLPGLIRLYPKDFNAVKLKIINEEYTSVNEFSEDMAHIINLALNDPDEVKLVRKKATNSVRSMFVKQMEKCFPWFNVKACQIWDKNQNFPPGMLPDAVLPPFEDHTYAQWLEREDPHKSPQPSPFKRVGNTPIKKIVPLPVDEDAEKVLSCDLEDSGEDIRRCILCWHYGDSDPNDAGRLLYVGQDDWVHVNCALWSAEVYEEEHDGTLQNVQTALSRGRVMRCDSCQRAGATVGCCTRGCPANYHFMCARQEHCLFQEDKKVFCPQHTEKVDGELVTKEKFAVNRRVCVSMEDLKFNKKTWSKGLDPSAVSVIIGSCTVEELGRLTPISDTRNLLLPVEFTCTRVFWSTQDIRKRCVYTCRIVEVKPDSPKSASVVIKDTTIIHDESHPDFVPLSQINIPGINLFPVTRPRTESLDTSRLSDESGLSKSFDTSGDCEIMNSTMNSNQSFYSSDAGNESLSSSWPVVKKRRSSEQQAVNFGVLSTNTLKLLNLKNPEKFQQSAKPCSGEKDDFGRLIKIADRLNMAAIGKSDVAKTLPRRERSRSVDRLLSPPPVRFSPSFRSEGHQSAGNSRSNSRANSEERVFSPIPTMSLQLSLDKEVTAVKPLIDNNCNSQVSDLNKTDVSMEMAETNSQEGGLEPINEEKMAEVDQSSETYVVLPEGCSELSDEDIQMITEAIERSRSEQGTDESMASVESTEDAGGEIGKQAGTESTSIPSTRAEGSSSETQEKTLGICEIENKQTVLSEKTCESSMKEDFNRDLMVEKNNVESLSVCQIDKSCDQNVNNCNVTKDAQNSNSTEKILNKLSIMGKELCSEQSKPEVQEKVVEPMDILQNVQFESSLVSSAETDAATSFDSVKQVPRPVESNEKLVPGQESGKLDLDGRSLEDKDVAEKQSEKEMETEVTMSNQETSSDQSTKQRTEEMQNNHDTMLEPTEEKGQQTSVKLKEDPVVPSLNGPEQIEESDIVVSVPYPEEKIKKSANKIPVYGREGQLIGYRKQTVEHRELRRLHYTTPKLSFEEILSEAQRQLQAEQTEKDTMSNSMEVQPSETTEKQMDDLNVENSANAQRSPHSVNHMEGEEQKEDVNLCVVSQEKTLEGMFGNDKLVKGSEEVPNKLDHGNVEECEVDMKETDVKKEEFDKDTNENSEQRTTEGESRGIDKDISSAQETLLNSNKEQGPLDEVPVKENHVSDSRTEEEKNDLFKGLGLARTPEVKKSKSESKKTPLKSYPLRRRSASAQGGAVKSDLPLHDQIAQKIKAESLAKSSPGDKGPFKCPTCKRLYRTEESFDTHVKTCDFEVSTSDEEEESENEGGTRKYSMRQTTVVKKVVMEIEQKERESENAARKEKVFALKSSCKKARLVLHKLSPRKVQQGFTKLSPRKRGRPVKAEKEDSSETVDSKVAKRLLSSDDEKKSNEVERKRRPTRHSTENTVSSDRLTRQSMSEVKSEDMNTKEMEDSESDVSPKRGRGRPKKSSIQPMDKKDEEKTPAKDESRSEDVAEKSGSEKRGRGRPRKSSIMAEEEIKKEIVSHEDVNSHKESQSESTSVSTRGRSLRKSTVSEQTRIVSRERCTRRSSSNHVNNGNDPISPPTAKRGRGRPPKIGGTSPKGLAQSTSDDMSDSSISPEKNKGQRGRPRNNPVKHVLRNEGLTSRRPVRSKKKVNLEYPGLSSIATKRNAILSRKIHTLRDSRMNKRKLKQIVSMQGKTISGSDQENGLKRERIRPARKNKGDLSKKEDPCTISSEQEKDPKRNLKEKITEIKPENSEENELDEKLNKGPNCKTEIKESILNVIKQSNTASLLKCPVQNVQSTTESEAISITDDDETENDVIFCEKTGDFLSKSDRKIMAKTCEIQCDLDNDQSAQETSKDNKVKKSPAKPSTKESPSKLNLLNAKIDSSECMTEKVEESLDSSTDTFVDRIMNDPAIQQLTPFQLLELQNKVTDKKVDISSLTKIDTAATIKSIKEFLKKKIEAGTNKTIYVTDTGNRKDQGQSSSGKENPSEPVSVMKVNLPSSVTPQDIQKIIEAHKRATGTLGKSESSIGITPISRSLPLQSLTSQSSTSVHSSTATVSQCSQAPLESSNPAAVRTNVLPPSSTPLLPQNFDMSPRINVATNNLLAAANAVSPRAILPSPNAIMHSPGSVISQAPNVPDLNTLLSSNPTPINAGIVPSQSAILPVGQQLPLLSPNAMLASPQPAIVSGGIQAPMYSVNNSSPGYQALTPAIVTLPEPQKTFLLPPNQNLITVPQSQNMLTIPPNPLLTPSIPQQVDFLSLMNNAGISASQSLLNSAISPVMNSTQYVQSVPQVPNIPSLQNVPQVLPALRLPNDNRQQQMVQNQSPASVEGPAIKSVPVRGPLQAYISSLSQNTSVAASNAISPVCSNSSSSTIVRVFVDGKPIAMTTDTSVLNDPSSLLAKLDPTALQKGKYNMSVTSHRVTSTTSLTVSTKGNATSYRPHCSPTTANKVLSALLKNCSTASAKTTLSTSALTKSLPVKSMKPASSAVKKTIFRKLTESVSVGASSVSGSSLPSSSLAIQPASHTRLPPALSQNRPLLPAPGGPVVSKIIRKADGTVLKKIIKSVSKGSDTEKNFAIQPKVMKAIMKKLGADKSVPILRKHGKDYDMLSVRVKSKAAIKAKEKRKHHRKSPQKVRLGLPPPSGTVSHPIIHPHKEAMMLPQPALEEEVEETPLSQFREEQREMKMGRNKKDGPKFQFQISSDDGFSCKGDSMAEAWQQVVEKVQDVRLSARMKHLSFTSLDPVQLFGVSYSSVVYLLEQLYGAQNCRNYNFKYHQYDIADLEEEPAENPSGCIRSEPFESRKPFDIFSFLMSQYRQMPNSSECKNDVEMVHKSARRATSMDLPMAMRYRKLKEHSREAVGVYRSHIHGRGLFCKRNIDEGEMVIEYSGEVIRASLTDKREKYYEGKGIGCYMFRIDDYDVIDATLHGSAARFINHSCEPNCYSKVINVDGKKHIVIFAMNSIKRGEELTYDYKFPIEEVKIPCTCGTKKCRRYLN